MASTLQSDNLDRSTYCSRSVSLHLLRGLGAVVLIVLTITYGGAHAWLLPPLLIGAVTLMQGCPMCWLMSLADAAKARHEPPHSGEVR
ncbi:MAG: hypothetical protein QOI87_1251 [Bradyrhizobium sp.]|nr:hypothetical protein [Bradyrhizobium sp.]